MKAPPKDKRNQIILVALGCVAISSGIWQGMIVSQKKGVAKVAQRIAEQQQKNDNSDRLVKATESMRRDLDSARKKLQRAESEMASGDMYSWVVQTLNKFREGYKVDIPQFSREVPCPVGVFATFPYRAVLFNIRGTAYFHDLGQFVADFENRFPHLRVQNLELEPAGSSAANNTTNDPEKLAFRMEIVALVSPNVH